MSTGRHTVLQSDRIGRYVVLGKLGAGGMGVVYSAFDEALDRRVAIKLLFASKAHHDQARRRFEREAQVLARLSHPNVVQVHEVGQHEGEVFMAMEYVQGTTFKAWAKQKPRAWPEVVACYRQAAQGLQAAHEAGILHRDFKPDNAIIGDDGRVRVLDFGLARLVESAESAESAESTEPAHEYPEFSSRGHKALDEPITVTGTVQGTPAYMAPEQSLGEPASARSDVFSFCVALFEALYGERPYKGQTRYAMLHAVMSGQLPNPERGVPARIDQLIRRGLALKPQDRPASMQELIDVLDYDPRRQRRRWLVGGAMVLVAMGTGLGTRWLGATAPVEPCAGFESRLSGVWDAERNAAVQEAFARSGSDLAETIGPRVSAALDERADALADGMREACMATRVTGEQSEERLDRRMSCLDDRLRSMRALTEVLADADLRTVAEAEGAVAGLPDPDVCAGAEFLDNALRPPRDAAQAERVEQVRELLAKGRALLATGHYLDAKPIAEQARAESDAINYEPLRAEVGYHHATLTVSLGEYRLARDTLLDVVDWAESSRHDQVAADAWLQLVHLGVDLLGDEVHVDEWIRRAIAADRRRGGVLNARVKLASLRAKLAIARGKLELARGYLEVGVQERDDAHRRGERSGRKVNLDKVRALLAMRDNEPQLAVEIYQRELEKVVAEAPAGHPDIARVHYGLGQALTYQGKLESAREHLEYARDSWERTYGGAHREIAGAELELGTIAMQLDDLPAAQGHFERAVRLMNQSIGDAHPDMASALNSLGTLLFNRGDYRGAADCYRRALGIFERAFGERRPELAAFAINLAEPLLYLGELQEARQALERGTSILKSKSSYRIDPYYMLSLKLMGVLALLDERPQEAVAPLRQALAILDERPNPSLELELNDVVLALAVATWPQDPKAARELATRVKPAGDVAHTRLQVLKQLLNAYEPTIRDLRSGER